MKAGLSAALENNLLSHDGSTEGHTRAVVELVLEKFSRPFFINFAADRMVKRGKVKRDCGKIRLQKSAEIVTAVWHCQSKVWNGEGKKTHEASHKV